MATLNQIFYGPPGTGKTYETVNEARRIINRGQNQSNSSLTTRDKFDRIMKVVRNKYSSPEFRAKTNSLYRNDRAIMWMLGWLLMPQFDKKNGMTRSQALAEGFDPSPSSWAQRAQFITQFQLVDDYTNSDIVLNAKGVELKNLVKDKFTIDELKNWAEEECPKDVQNFYANIIANQELGNFTPMIKTFYSAINMLLNGMLYKRGETQDPTPEERVEAERFFDLPPSTKDLKWIGQIGRVFEGLGLAQKSEDSLDGKVLFNITEFGEKLVNEIIDNWIKKHPDIFESDLTFEAGVELGLIKFVTFHQSYSYEEFIEGIRPTLNDDEALGYTLTSGVFKDLCDKARFDLEQNYVIVIDEINRGNVSKIFGELITLIESSKRLFGDSADEIQQVTLPYSKTLFGVPKNVFLIGTMNTADRSITSLDTALRRRFSFIEFPPQPRLLENIKIRNGSVEINLEEVLDSLNKRIEFFLDKDHLIGHSYFMGLTSWEQLCETYRDKIIPLLREYFYNDWEKIALVLGDNPENGKSDIERFILKRLLSSDTLFGFSDDRYEDRESYEINHHLVSGNYMELSPAFFVKGLIKA